MVIKTNLKTKTVNTVHGLMLDHRPSSPNTASWVYNIGSDHLRCRMVM